MQTAINKPLQDLMQTAQFVTPERGPTVAAKYAQAAQQKIQMESAPPGIEALLPGVRQQAMMSAQAAQPATQGDVNQLRQMMARAAPSQGIAPGVDVQMAEGGIVGYDGRTGSEVEIDETKLPVGERFKRRLRSLYEAIETDFMKRAGATPEMIAQKLGKEPSVPVSPLVSPEQVPPSEAFARPRTDMVQQAPAPSPRPPSGERKQRAASSSTPTGIASTPLLPDTRESTAVNPSEAALMFAQMQGGLKELLERQNKPRELTPAELKETAARKEEIERRMGEIDASKARFEQAKQERLAGQQGQGLRDLASFLSRAKGPSIFAGLGEATLGMEPVFAARAAQEQKFREQELAFMDKLGERRDLVTDMRLASLKDDAGRAREDAARLRALDMEISKLGLGLGEKRMAELANTELERERISARAKENERNIQAQKELEVYRRQTQLMKPRELEEIHRIEALKLNELTGGKPGTATPQQKLEAIQFAHESVKGAGRAGGVDAKNNAAALRELGQWEKDVGANIKAMNAKNPQAYEDARRAKIREINATLGSTIPLDGGAGAGAVDTNNPLLKK